MVRLLGVCLLGGMLLGAAGLLLGDLSRTTVAPFSVLGRSAASVTGAVHEDLDAKPAPLAPVGAVRESLTVPHPSFAGLGAEVDQLLQEAGGAGGITLIELGGRDPRSWSLNGDQTFVAASTYKQPLLMMDAELVAGGRAGPDDSLCYEDDDWEDGYFGDYVDGACYSRSELERRVGEYSDNTAAHILVRYDGGPDALNAYASAHGATESDFYVANTTTSDDLARLWANEAAGQAGGTAAQKYLYPLLTDTDFEDGIPAGVPSGVTVVHKVGFLDSDLNDSALVTSGPAGAYALAICTDGPASWSLLASISQAVWTFEATR
ncbi:MAG: serine hydrolase [Candidatus Dormibacteraeota bacterium]|nr:serine hydrolase [Candidatus Dormibacteraeota bacterium]